MKVRRSIMAAALLAVVLLVVSVLLLQPPPLSTTKSATICLRGYTNIAGTEMAVFDVTNHTKSDFLCFVGPRASEASKGGRPLYHDTSAAAPPGTLPALGAFSFSVLASPDKNWWRVSVELKEIDAGRPGLQRALAGIARLVGVHSFDARAAHLTSPAFSRHERKNDTRNHWSDYGRASLVGKSDALGRPHSSVPSAVSGRGLSEGDFDRGLRGCLLSVLSVPSVV